MRRTSVALLVVLLGLSLVGCGSRPAPGSQSPSGSVASVTDPVALIGSWVAADNPAVEQGTVLRIGEDLSLWTSCGYLMGSWRADHRGQFAASIVGGDEACVAPTSGRPTPAWLRAATGFALDGTGLTLTADDGSVVVRLSAGGRPTPGPNLLPSLADPPVVTDLLRSVLAAPAPLPATRPPARHDQVVGSWVSALPRPSSSLIHRGVPGITFGADGAYRATDGCNETEGRWTSDDSGALLVTGGFSTAVGCDNVPVAEWAGRAAWATLDGDVLVLVGPDGAETGRLRRP